MNINQTTFDNGLNSVIVPMEDTPTATVMVMVNAGTRFESAQVNGISHFLEHMFFKGTENRPSSHKVAVALDSIGAESNAFTWYDHTAYFGKVQAGKTQEILDVLSDIYKNPLFPEDEIEKEASVIQEEIRKYDDNPSINVHYAFHEQIYGDHPLGRPVLGSEKTVSEIQQSNLITYRDTHYSPANTVVAVAGSMNEEVIRKEVADKFSTLKPSTPPEPDNAPADTSSTDDRLLVREKDSQQTHLIVGTTTINRANDRRPALDVLSTLVGKGQSSRLYNKLREEMGVCYSVGTDVEYFSDTGLFKMVAGVDTNRVPESVSAMVNVLTSVAQDPIPDDEFTKAKEHRVGNYLLNHETTDEVARDLARQSVLEDSVEPPQVYAQKLRNVSKEEVINEAESLLNNGLQAALIGPDCDESAVTEALR